MSQKIKPLVIAMMLFSSCAAIADNVSVYSAGTEIAGSNKPTSFNVYGDTVQINRHDFEAIIFKGKDNTGVSALVKQGDKTPFDFSSITIRNVKGTPQNSEGLFFEVGKGKTCVHLAVELQSSKGYQDLYPTDAETYTHSFEPDFRKFKLICHVDGKIDIADMAIKKLGTEEVRGKDVLLTVISEDAVANTYGGYNYHLNGKLPDGDLKGSFSPDQGFNYMGNYDNWRAVFKLSAQNHVLTVK